MALTATSAPMVAPSGSTAEAEPSPPRKVAVVAPVPAPVLPIANSVAAFDSAARPSAFHGFSVQP